MSRPSRFALSLLPLALGTSSCTKPPADAAPSRTVDPLALPNAASASHDAASAQDAAGASVAAAAAPSDAAAPSVASESPVRVKIVTIGMHVGGGPYDEVTKEPIKRSVEPHFAELARCWKLVPDPKQADVGVDLVIEAKGGHAKVSNPRTTASGEGFVPCVVAFYEGVDFLKPNNGKTVVSYSVRFLPGK